MKFLESLMSRRRMIFVTVAILSLSGLASWFGMPRQEDPSMPDYWGNIVAVFPGADAETVERLMLEPIEERLAEVDGIGSLTATAWNELVMLDIELDPHFGDLEEAWDDIQDAMERAYADFPDGAGSPVLNRDLNDQESVVLAITGSNDPLVLEQAARDLKKDLLSLKQVAIVKLIGEPEEQIIIEYDDAIARRLGLDPGAAAYHLANRNRMIPGGSIKLAGRTVSLKPHTDFESLEEIRNTPIVLPSGAAMPLSEVAKVRRSPKEPASAYMRFNGSRSVGLGIVPASGVHLVEFGNAVREKVASVKQKYAPLAIDYIIYQPDRVQDRLNNLGSSLLMGVLIVAGILLLVMGFRLGLVVAGVLPLVALASLALFAVSGGTLQQISIAALVIALGMLVDNAIVMAENIQWRIDQGEQPRAAAIAAVREMAIPLGSATGTTLAAFVPMLMAEGTTADFTRDLPIVIVLTLTVSYIFAIFVTPQLSEMLLRKRERVASKVQASSKLADFAIRRPFVVLALATVLVGASFMSAGLVQGQFFPASDRNQLIVQLSLPEGSHIDETSEYAKRVERELFAMDEVTAVSSYIGRSAPHFYYNISQIPWSPHFAQILVETTDQDTVDTVMNRIRQFGRDAMPQAELIPKKLEQGPPVESPVEIRLFGSNLEDLDKAVDKTLALLKAVPGTVDHRHNLSLGSPRLRFSIDDAAAARFGLNRSDVAHTLFGKTRGIPVGQYRAGDDPEPVVLRSKAGESFDIDHLETIDISTSEGVMTPLAQVAGMDLEWRPAAINHRERKRVAVVSSHLSEGFAFSDVLKVMAPEMSALQLPPGVTYEFGGLDEGSSEANSSMATALPFGLLLLVGILLAEFNSFRRVGIILVTAPLAATGVIPGLIIGNQPFGFMSLLGVFALIGVVVNNAIVLLDVIDSRREQGALIEEAIKDAIMRRTRPILLTTATTVAGLTPLALSNSSLWPPLAWAMISGLLASTLLTLMVVPALYLVLFRPRRRNAVGASGLATAMFFLMWAAPYLAAQEPAEMNLKEVMAHAAQRPFVVAAQYEAEAVRSSAEAVRRSGILPTVETKAGFTAIDEAPEIQTPAGNFQLGKRESTTAQASIALPLIDIATRRYRSPAAFNEAKAAEYNAGRARETAVASAADAFLHVLGIDAQMKATEAFITSLADRLKETQARVELGRTLEADALKVRLDLDSAQQDLLSLQSNRAVAVQLLGRAIGLQSLVEPQFNWGDPLPKAPALTSVLLDSIQSRSDLTALGFKTKAADLRGKSIAAERLPRLDVQAQYSWADGDAFRDGSHWQASLQMSWKPFSGGTRAPRLAASRAEVRSLQARMQEARDGAELEIRAAHAAMVNAHGAFEVAKSGVDLARESLRVERERYQNGRVTINDLLEAEARLRNQVTDKDIAQLRVIQAQIQLDLATGAL